METRANFILIGAFTLAGFLGLMGFFIWFSKAELDRQFAYYDAFFDNVSGLDRASDVRFAGLSVGQVVELRLSEDQDGTVRVRLEVAADTPIREDSVATIESQGVTGVAYVAITSGDPDAPLAKGDGDDIPVLESDRSTLQSLTQDAPRLLSEILEIAEQVNGLLSDENRDRVENIILNLESSSEKLDQTLSDFSTVAANVGESVSEIARFTGELEGIAGAVERTLTLADDAIVAVEDLSEKAEITFEAGTQTLQSAQTTIERAGNFISDDLRVAMSDLTQTSASIRRQTDELGIKAGDLLDTWRDTGISATARLTQADELLAEADIMVDDLVATLDAVESAAVSFETLMDGDGAALVAETRAAMDSARQAADGIAQTVGEDVPGIVADVRSAATTARNAIDTIAADLSSTTGRLEGLSDDAQLTMTTVTETFSRANTTLGAIERALATGERTLAAAERTFDGADRVINEDVDEIATALRGAIGRLDQTVAQVSEEIPLASQDLRAAAESARVAFSDLSGIVTGARGPINDFVSGGLPQFTRLGAETRRLISTLDSLATRIERDPARFLLNNGTPEYRR
ncbi:phospholipid/cholesterol/gamma-HCH transport system substrate-binding protein [Poseidonocella pacifica]|uniref:Phospholipid/cholesterol/gamma-HCH transport system substrate-binding protein n=1 Tax=Poseidonocella pacifica TaxID=871651 RepID=A0A1I0XD10_9RHOB|nr:MlaD family protein [Poseidonocella pacifica]SFA98939.1 phospholipid/cholesterol/gamma-HCH transport system substrate-binding protein [Poseidonocella pacifica]